MKVLDEALSRLKMLGFNPTEIKDYMELRRLWMGDDDGFNRDRELLLLQHLAEKHGYALVSIEDGLEWKDDDA